MAVYIADTGNHRVQKFAPALPTASFSASPTSGTAPLGVAFTDTSTNASDSRSWYFGDERHHRVCMDRADLQCGVGQEKLSAECCPSGRKHHHDGGIADGGDLPHPVWRSTDKGVTWTLQTAAAAYPSRLEEATVVLPDGSIVVIGGTQTLHQGLNDVWRSPDRGITWIQQTAAAVRSTMGHTAVVLQDGSIVLMGGNAGEYYGQYRDEVYRSTDKGVTWTCINQTPGWTARDGHSSVVLQDGSIVLMGGDNNSGSFFNDVWRSTDKGFTWTCVNPSAGWTGRSHHTSVVLPDGSILLMGGAAGPYDQNDVWRSADKGVTWTQLTDGAPWSSRTTAASVVLPDGSVVLMGGYSYGADMSLARQSDVWRLETASSTDRNPRHVYTSPGSYSVALRTWNPNGFSDDIKTGYVRVAGVALVPVPSAPALPTDTNGDGLHDDVNGNGRKDFADVVLYFNQMSWIAANEPVPVFRLQRQRPDRLRRRRLALQPPLTPGRPPFSRGSSVAGPKVHRRRRTAYNYILP